MFFSYKETMKCFLRTLGGVFGQDTSSERGVEAQASIFEAPHKSFMAQGKSM